MIHAVERRIRSAYRRLKARERKVLPRLAFVHIPKCGGTSLKTALQDVYSRRGNTTLWLDPHASKRAADVADADLYALRAHLLLYHLAQRRPRYITGHYTFSEAAWEAGPEPWAFLTVLRDPVARWYSAYFYNRHKTNSDHFRIHEPLAEFVETERAQKMGRTYVRRLTADRKAPDAVETVILTLQRFDVVGVLEEMDALVRDCERVVGERLSVPILNTSPRGERERADEITPAIEAKVRALCAPDLRIYEAVRERIMRDGGWTTR